MASLIQEPERFRRNLLRWYAAHGRDLPWRRTRLPYRIWVSEIMLQQTRVAAVLDYYRRFIRAFPTVKALAAAEESSVLAQWSGLGYYRRARMMHRAAQLIMAEHKGRFPRTSAGLRELPGIGRYTAAAIASIAYSEAAAVVDGNVQRVLSRLLAAESPDIWQTAQQLLDPARPADFNQAMMELGATVCTPKAPKCGECPVVRFCLTRGEHPVAAPAKRNRASLDYLLASNATSLLMVQRDASASLMAGMWELPAWQADTTIQVMHIQAMRFKHSITNTDYQVNVYRAPLERRYRKFGKLVDLRQLAQLPLTGVARKAITRAGLLSARD